LGAFQNLKPADAIYLKDKVLATQQRCHENISWYQKRLNYHRSKEKLPHNETAFAFYHNNFYCG
jgi:hypothetical protein